MLTKEEKQELNEREREYRQTAKEHKNEIKELKSERKKDRKAEKKNSKLNKETKNKNNKTLQKPADQKKILSVFPIRDYSDNGGFFITSDNSIIDIFQIQGRSFFDASDDEIENMVFSNAKFLQKYSDDFKIVGMNYPTSTKHQQAFLSYQLKRPELEKYYDMISEKLSFLETIDRTTTDRQAFIFVFAKDKSHYAELMKVLRSDPYFHVDAISREKKENIIFQLNNMNKRIKV